jgi:uncharacterized delta-60 repeat protein
MITYPFGFFSNQNSSLVESLFMGGYFDKFQGKASIALASSNVYGVSSNLDSGFADSTTPDIVYAIFQDPGEIDKIYVGGAFTSYDGNTANRIIKLNLDGTVDTSFNTGTGFNDIVYSITMIGGKLYVGGNFTTYQGTAANRIIRLNRDGSKDTGFDNSTGFNDIVSDVEVWNDKIYVGGTFTSYKGTTANRIIRLNLDGSKDTSFDNSTGFDATSDVIAVDPTDGSIYVGGFFTTYKGVSANKIVKIFADGTRDTSFDVGTGFSGANQTPTSNFCRVRGLALDSVGNLYAAGNFTQYKGAGSYTGLIGLQIDGTVNASFDVGTGFSDGSSFGVGVKVLPWKDEATFSKIYVSGSFTYYKGVSGNNGIIRINANGSKDTSFGNNPGFEEATPNAMLVYEVTRVAPPTYILDQYSGAARAYSVRKLSSAYTGPAIRVRRSSDNVESDIGFLNQYNLDTTALLNFCGAGDGFIKTWYDQSGNGINAIQTDTARQPKIVSSGVVETVAGEGDLARPAIKFDGTNDHFEIVADAVAPTVGSIFGVFKNVAKGGGFWAFNQDLGGDVHHPWTDNNIYENFAANTRLGSSSTGDTTLSQHLYSIIGASNYRVRLNKSLIITAASNTPSFDTTKYFLGSSYVPLGSDFYYNGYYQEVIVYFANKTSDVAKIEENLNTYFSVI